MILLSLQTEDIPQVPDDERLEFTDLGNKFYQVVGHYGFMESPEVPKLLQQCQAHGVSIRPLETTYYLGRETLIATPDRLRDTSLDQSPRPPLATWRKKLFIIMSRNAQSASSFFNLPPNRVVEMGAQIQF